MAAADDKKKKQKTTESLDDAVKQLGLSKRAIHEVVRVATARAAELSGQRVGMDLLHALTRRIKSEEGQPSSEQVKEQCLYAMHECLMQIDAIGKASGKLCSQIETLAEKCTELCGNQPVCRVQPVRNRHRHAIEQASRRWRGGRRDDSARTRRKLLIST